MSELDDETFWDRLTVEHGSLTSHGQVTWYYDEKTLRVWAQYDDYSEGLVADNVPAEEGRFMVMAFRLMPEIIKRAMAARDEAERLDIECDQVKSELVEMDLALRAYEKDERFT